MGHATFAGMPARVVAPTGRQAIHDGLTYVYHYVTPRAVATWLHATMPDFEPPAIFIGLLWRWKSCPCLPGTASSLSRCPAVLATPGGMGLPCTAGPGPTRCATIAGSIQAEPLPGRAGHHQKARHGFFSCLWYLGIPPRGKRNGGPWMDCIASCGLHGGYMNPEKPRNENGFHLWKPLVYWW